MIEQPSIPMIGPLLDENSLITIPKYQRGYDWKDSAEVKEFFDDLVACINSKENKDLFLGTMIFDTSGERSHQTVEVIDGQQRLTTIIITLVACREYAKVVLENSELALLIQQKISRVSATNKILGNKMQASDTIVHVFDAILDRGWDGNFPDKLIVEGRERGVKLQNNRVRPVYQQAFRSICEYCEKSEDKFEAFLSQIYTRTYIIRINITEKEEAFEIFERTNARGKNLEIADLLKNYLFSKEAEIDEDVQEKWKLLTENSVGSLPRMLKYFYVSRRGYVPQRDLYREIRNYSNEVGVNQFVTELGEFSVFYKAVRGSDRGAVQEWLFKNGFAKEQWYLNEAARAMGALKYFNITQATPLIFSFFKAYQKSGARDPKKFLNFLRLIESYHFINNKVLGQIGNEVEQLYADTSKLFYESADFTEQLATFESEIMGLIKTEKAFAASFAALSYTEMNEKALLLYAFDRLANHKVKDGQREDLIDYNYKENGVQSSYDLDHIFCQSKLGDGDGWGHTVGNLIVIPKQINGILGSKSFQDKIDIYLNPEEYNNNIKNVPGYLRAFAKSYKDKSEWTKEDVENRSMELGGQLYQYLVHQYRY